MNLFLSKEAKIYVVFTKNLLHLKKTICPFMFTTFLDLPLLGQLLCIQTQIEPNLL